MFDRARVPCGSCTDNGRYTADNSRFKKLRSILIYMCFLLSSHLIIDLLSNISVLSFGMWHRVLLQDLPTSERSFHARHAYLLVTCFAYLKSATFYQTTECHIEDDGHRCDNPKLCMLSNCVLIDQYTPIYYTFKKLTLSFLLGFPSLSPLIFI
jgi:hypothetical protein